MKKLPLVILGLCLTTVVANLSWGYGEGPSDSGRWIYGRVTYGDGSKCGKCCSISVETENGFSKEGCTDDSGNYKIYVASSYARAVYFRGSRVWSGSNKTKGGTRIDIRAR